MNILVDQSGYALMNMGDRAMLQMALQRLQDLWPNSKIQVFTTAPEILQQACPGVRPCSPLGRYFWSVPISHRFHETLATKAATSAVTDFEWQWRNRFPETATAVIRSRSGNKPQRMEPLEEFIESVRCSDLVISTGGGYITDSFQDHACRVLNTLELAHHLGKPTALVGQGLGPIENPILYNRAKAVLPKVDLITLREKRAGLPLCSKLGISPHRRLVTGDDAIELAYNHRPESLGNGLGVNLRVANYSGVNQSLLDGIRATLQTAARQLNAPILPIPIAHSEEESDPTAIRQLLLGYDDTSDGGASLDTPIKVIQQAGRCRVTVTGSYHAAVFSLSQGVPVIGLAKSDYYVDKFAGLAEQFGIGCEILLMTDRDFQEQLATNIHSLWHNAEIIHNSLLESAREQIQLGHIAYQKLSQLVEFQCKS